MENKYKGRRSSGQVLDDSWGRGYPEAFRLKQVIEGWKLALTHKNIGDHGMIYIPYN